MDTTSPVVGSRVEFLRDALPAKAGDIGTVVRVKSVPSASDIVVVDWNGQSIATRSSEIRLVTADPTATDRLSERSRRPLKQ